MSAKGVSDPAEAKWDIAHLHLDSALACPKCLQQPCKVGRVLLRSYGWVGLSLRLRGCLRQRHELMGEEKHKSETSGGGIQSLRH